MKIRISTAAAIALFAIAPLTITRAQAAATQCNDGTTSSAVGKGACSGHGGVKSAKSATKTGTKSAATKSAGTKSKGAKAATKTAKAATKSAEPKTAAKTKSVSASDKDPKDATATCKDGTYSHAANHSGACSGHGGVLKFLK